MSITFLTLFLVLPAIASSQSGVSPSRGEVEGNYFRGAKETLSAPAHSSPSEAEETEQENDLAEETLPGVRRSGEPRSVFERFADGVVAGDDQLDISPNPVSSPSTQRSGRSAISSESTAKSVTVESSRTHGSAVSGLAESSEARMTENGDDSHLVLASGLRLPRGSFRDLELLWDARVRARTLSQFTLAQEITEDILTLRDELAILSMPRMATAVVREGTALFEQDDLPGALFSAELALNLAPDLPVAHWFKARVLWAHGFSELGAALSASLKAVGASTTRISSRNTHSVNLLVTMLMALMFAGLVFLAVTTARTWKYYVHDFHHIFPDGTSRIRTSFIVVAILLGPILLQAGLALIVLVASAAAWLHATKRERLLLAATIVLFTYSPYFLGHLAQKAVFWGTPAEHAWRLERADAWQPSLIELEDRVRRNKADWAEIFALARFLKRDGDFDRAVSLYHLAGELQPDNPAIHNNLGVALFALNELTLAERAFIGAQELDHRHAGAWLNLSRLYLRNGESNRARDALQRAEELDYRIALGYSEGEDRLNVTLHQDQLKDQHIMALATAPEDFSGSVIEQVRAFLGGRFLLAASPFVPLVALPLLLFAAYISSTTRLAAPCVKCGRTACARCDTEVGSGMLCGQCVNVFQKKNAVSQSVRQEKEDKVRRHNDCRESSARFISLVLPGSGHLMTEQPISGFLLFSLFCWGALTILWKTGPLPLADACSVVTGDFRPVVGTLLLLIAWFIGNWSLWRGLR